MTEEGFIYDVGMNDGRDSAFYLHRGFRVVAIEANPILCDKARQEFSKEIASGQMTLLNMAVSEVNGERDFYVNLDNDEWSSLDPEWGTRQNTRFEKIRVRTVAFHQILGQYGTPHYLKVDVEGADRLVLNELRSAPGEKPQYISVEEHEIDYFPLLWALGYRGFKVVNQEDVPNLSYKDWQFKRGATGPFGEEIPGQWMPFGDAMLDYMLNIRDCREQVLFSKGWFDIHATLDTPALPRDQPYPRRREVAFRSKVESRVRQWKRRLLS